ncbi:hypothetical protein [Streptomyces phaeoluteigriseus]|uniref:hypothetical protein n=1 Tax=Streptomyces phaeoluteigriseus TaxID=114686 RepID=UPI003CCB80BF
MSRTADVSVGTAAPREVTFKNTWSWDDHWTRGVPVDLEEGPSKVTFANASAWAPNIDRIELGRIIG